ncbi:hypothetical protein [Luteolibacter sp. LG18]|uniref:hypothetical protein n=1 Tax=Luteolibacter sp. LG18 TaxID=2819286 RepID=UPI002B30B4D7|nr:hypothetical protein llg_37830 [Luteolibacter sp. LG18]
MLPPHEQPDSLQIRCPSCGQRFKVGAELRDRTVECGSCEHRFRIDDDTILRAKKFYPGEKRDPRLDMFARVPHAPPVEPTIQRAAYAPEPSHASFEPPSPLRTMTGIVAVVGMISIALVLALGARHGGLLDGVATGNRLALAAFAGLAGGALLVYANPRGRKKAIGVSLLFLAGLLALPFVFDEASAPLGGNPSSPVAKVDSAKGADPKTPESTARIELTPLVEENARLAAAGNGTRAIGVWLRNLRESNQMLVRDYLVRGTGADIARSTMYARGTDEWLMVLSPLTGPVEKVAEVVGRLGRDGDATRIMSDLNVVQVNVDNALFVSGPLEKLQDKNDPAFYDLNRREMESIDPDRVSKAVKRLAEAEPKVYREDITRLLVQHGKDADAALLGNLARALSVWSPPGQSKATEVMEAGLKRVHAARVEPSRELVAFLVSRKVVSIAPVVDELWVNDATAWESLYGDLGPDIEPLILKRLPEAKPSQRQSAVRLLGRVGTSKSLAPIAALAETADPELKVIMERSMKAIRERN